MFLFPLSVTAPLPDHAAMPGPCQTGMTQRMAVAFLGAFESIISAFSSPLDLVFTQPQLLKQVMYRQPLSSNSGTGTAENAVYGGYRYGCSGVPVPAEKQTWWNVVLRRHRFVSWKCRHHPIGERTCSNYSCCACQISLQSDGP